MTITGWYWCLTHARVESAEDNDDPDNALGPFPTEDDARNWRERHETRAAQWKADDEAWEGEPPD